MNPYRATRNWVLRLPPIRRRRTNRVAEHALAALHAAAQGDCTTGHRITTTVLNRYGPGAAQPLAQVWSGVAAGLARRATLLPDADADADADVGVGLKFVNVAGGDTAGADQVPAPVGWAGQLIAATCADDRDMVRVLIGVLPDDQHGREQHLGALLHSAALALVMQGGEGQTP